MSDPLKHCCSIRDFWGLPCCLWGNRVAGPGKLYNISWLWNWWNNWEAGKPRSLLLAVGTWMCLGQGNGSLDIVVPPASQLLCRCGWSLFVAAQSSWLREQSYSSHSFSRCWKLPFPKGSYACACSLLPKSHSGIYISSSAAGHKTGSWRAMGCCAHVLSCAVQWPGRCWAAEALMGLALLLLGCFKPKKDNLQWYLRRTSLSSLQWRENRFAGSNVGLWGGVEVKLCIWLVNEIFLNWTWKCWCVEGRWREKGASLAAVCLCACTGHHLSQKFWQMSRDPFGVMTSGGQWPLASTMNEHCWSTSHRPAHSSHGQMAW